HVFCGINGFENFLCVHLFGKWELDEDAVHVVVAIEIVHELKHVFGGGRSGRSVQPACQAELFGGGDFAFDVDLGTGIFSDEDGSESGADALRAQASDFVLKFDKDLVADLESIEDACSHARLTFGKMKVKNNIERSGTRPWPPLPLFCISVHSKGR